MKKAVIVLLVLSTNYAFAGSKHLQCSLNKILEASANPASVLDIQADLDDSSKTIVNGVQVTKAAPAGIAAQIGMSQLVQWNSQQLAISADFSKAFIKDIAAYSCVEAE